MQRGGQRDAAPYGSGANNSIVPWLRVLILSLVLATGAAAGTEGTARARRSLQLVVEGRAGSDESLREEERRIEAAVSLQKEALLQHQRAIEGLVEREQGVAAGGAPASPAGGAQEGVAATAAALAAGARRLERSVGLQKQAMLQQQRAIESLATEQSEVAAKEAMLESNMRSLFLSKRRLSFAARALPPPRGGAPLDGGGLRPAEGSGPPTTWVALGMLRRALLGDEEEPLETGLPVVQVAKKGAWKETLLSGVIFLACTLIAAYLYGVCFTYPYPPLKLSPLGPNREHFTFGLLHGFQCDPDWRICCCSCCCAGVRWADSVSSSKVRFVSFWQALLLFAFLQWLGGLTVFAMLLLLLVVVLGRQRIRAVYDLPHSDCDTCCQDCLVWLCCSPCAIMQEASQIEFVELPAAAAQQGTSPFETHSAQLGGGVGPTAQGVQPIQGFPVGGGVARPAPQQQRM